jgi:succinate-acetate transporter protein
MTRLEAWGYFFLFSSTLFISLSATVLKDRWQIAASIIAILLAILSVFTFHAIYGD